MSEPSQGTTENPQVVKVEGGIPANIAIRIYVISTVFLALLAVGVPLLIRWHDQEARISDIEGVARTNRVLVRKNGDLQAQVRKFVTDQCIAAESRDVVNVQTNDALILLLNRLVPHDRADVPAKTRADVDSFIQSLRDANRTLEPEGEKDCEPGPEGGTP